ncbi:formin-like protein 14 [Hyposmocoma kahamanoa]|uniref:formin-like protein 14 n=1 Tax=Hyposmocoma kahamanoa TaxID=1477025 RepID=UPI000E6D5B2A|nr:formin-like protein 14 [Hyposmocoma kahamanoa]
MTSPKTAAQFSNSGPMALLTGEPHAALLALRVISPHLAATNPDPRSFTGGSSRQSTPLWPPSPPDPPPSFPVGEQSMAPPQPPPQPPTPPWPGPIDLEPPVHTGRAEGSGVANPHALVAAHGEGLHHVNHGRGPPHQ